MGKIINTLRYGKAKTKTLIISVFVLMVAAIVIGIIGINGMNIIMLGVSMVLFIICIFMVFKLESATTQVDGNDAPKEKVRKGVPEDGIRRERPKDGALDSGNEKQAGSVTEERKGTASDTPAGERKDGVMPDPGKRRQEAEEKLLKTLRGKSRGPRAIRAQLERKLLVEIIRANRRSTVVDKRTFEKHMKEAVKERKRKAFAQQRVYREDADVRRSGNPADARRSGISDEIRRTEVTDEERRKEKKESSAPERSLRSEKKTDYKTYTKNEVKRLRKIYKIPKDACRIIIDSCKSLAIDHAPAFFWVKKGRIYLLVFEESARCETLPMGNMKVSYKRNIREDEIIKYNSMREMGVYKDFEDMMPTFSIHGGAAGNEYYKNLYVLGKDLELTPRSLRSLMASFTFDIEIFESLGIKGNYSKYFKKAYEQRIMWTDTVISQGQYQNNIRDILQSLVDDDTIIRYDFMDDLGKMVHHRLITDEYAEFYKNKRL